VSPAHKIKFKNPRKETKDEKNVWSIEPAMAHIKIYVSDKYTMRIDR